jgi:hypothetical protein
MLGCDNTAVIGTLRRGYSHLPIAHRLLNQYRNEMLEGVFQVHYVPSAENVADALSHRRQVDPAAEKASLERLIDAGRGY